MSNRTFFGSASFTTARARKGKRPFAVSGSPRVASSATIAKSQAMTIENRRHGRCRLSLRSAVCLDETWHGSCRNARANSMRPAALGRHPGSHLHRQKTSPLPVRTHAPMAGSVRAFSRAVSSSAICWLIRLRCGAVQSHNCDSSTSGYIQLRHWPASSLRRRATPPWGGLEEAYVKSELAAPCWLWATSVFCRRSPWSGHRVPHDPTE